VESYREFWTRSFDRLDEYLHELQGRKLHAKEKRHARKHAKK